MFTRFLAVATVITILILQAHDVRAQGAGVAVNPIIMVLDIGTIRREAASVKAIREQIIGYQNTLQSEIQKEQEALRSAQQDLAKKQSLLAPEAFQEERRKFEQQVAGVQQKVQQQRRSLEESQTKAMLQVERALNEVVASLAQKNGYAMVIRRSQIVVADTSLDITKTVLDELDRVLPTVQVDSPTK